MGGSRRKFKRSKTSKVQVGLPRKHPNVFKPAFNVPPKLKSILDPLSKWDAKASVIANYKACGVVSNPNFLGARARTAHMIESEALQMPPRQEAIAEFDPIDSGSDLEEDDLKTALSKKRRDGRAPSLQPLTTIQRIHVSRLVEKYGDDYQSMFMDHKLNQMQHSVATLENLCKRYHMYQDKNPVLFGSRA